MLDTLKDDTPRHHRQTDRRRRQALHSLLLPDGTVAFSRKTAAKRRQLPASFERLPPAEREEALDYFSRYLDLMIRISRRIERDPQAQERLRSLTRKIENGSMEDGRPFTNQDSKQ